MRGNNSKYLRYKVRFTLGLTLFKFKCVFAFVCLLWCDYYRFKKCIIVFLFFLFCFRGIWDRTYNEIFWVMNNDEGAIFVFEILFKFDCVSWSYFQFRVIWKGWNNNFPIGSSKLGEENHTHGSISPFFFFLSSITILMHMERNMKNAALKPLLHFSEYYNCIWREILML